VNMTRPARADEALARWREIPMPAGRAFAAALVIPILVLVVGLATRLEIANTPGLVPAGSSPGGLVASWFDITLTGSAPIQRHDAGVTVWTGYHVSLCNVAVPGGTFTYVGAEAKLRLADGTIVPAVNGRGRSPAGSPPWLEQRDGWIDKANLQRGECITGWLVFRRPQEAQARSLEWHGAVLGVAEDG
jgi:hypothetical protein